MDDGLTGDERLEIEISLVEKDRSLTDEERTTQIRALLKTSKYKSVDELREAIKQDYE